jgi:hypothetical protein
MSKKFRTSALTGLVASLWLGMAGGTSAIGAELPTIEPKVILAG